MNDMVRATIQGVIDLCKKYYSSYDLVSIDELDD